MSVLEGKQVDQVAPRFRTSDPNLKLGHEWPYVRAGTSTNPYGFNRQQFAEFLEIIGEMADTDRAMVCGPVAIPGFDETVRAYGKPVAAIRVAELEDRAGHRFALGHK
jgi:hypothetical protein